MGYSRTGSHPGLFAYTLFLAFASLVLIVAGSLVTTTGSGLSVPDWPLSYGRLWPRMVGGVVYEHTHRTIAAGVGILTIGLVVLASRVGGLVRRLSWVALGVVVAQGILGGLTVLLQLPPAVSIAHASLAQIFFCLIISLVFLTSPGRTGAGALPCERRLGRLSAAALAAIFLQIGLGAYLRHVGSALALWLHVIGALIAVTAVLACTAVGLQTQAAPLRRLSGHLALLLFVQLALGLTTLLSRDVLATKVGLPGWLLAVVSSHVVVGSLMLAAALWLVLDLERRRRVPMDLDAGTSP